MQITKKGNLLIDYQYFVRFCLIPDLDRGFDQLITGCAIITTFSPIAVRLYDNPEQHHRRALWWAAGRLNVFP